MFSFQKKNREKRKNRKKKNPIPRAFHRPWNPVTPTPCFPLDFLQRLSEDILGDPGAMESRNGPKKEKKMGEERSRAKIFFTHCFCLFFFFCPFRLTPRRTNLPRVSYVAYTCRLLYLFPSSKMEQKNEVGVACKQARGRTFSVEVWHKPDVSSSNNSVTWTQGKSSFDQL